jgi:hypothetical protein
MGVKLGLVMYIVTYRHSRNNGAERGEVLDLVLAFEH